MGQIMWHQTTPQRLEPVGPDRDYGAGVGPDQPRYQPGRQPLTSHESLGNRAI